MFQRGAKFDREVAMGHEEDRTYLFVGVGSNRLLYGE